MFNLFILSLTKYYPQTIIGTSSTVIPVRSIFLEAKKGDQVGFPCSPHIESFTTIPQEWISVFDFQCCKYTFLGNIKLTFPAQSKSIYRVHRCCFASQKLKKVHAEKHKKFNSIKSNQTVWLILGLKRKQRCFHINLELLIFSEYLVNLQEYTEEEEHFGQLQYHIYLLNILKTTNRQVIKANKESWR